VEARLRETVAIPPFSTTINNGTAVVVLAALINALNVVGKPTPHRRIVAWEPGRR